MKKLIDWCKKYFLSGALLFIIAFIPLYPKLPVLDVSQTWVYIRLEDFIIAVVCLLLCVIFIKDKRLPDSSLALPIVLYWIVGFISLIWALLFIFPSFGGVLFPKVAVFHFIRRIEYLSLFFLGVEAVRARPSLIKQIAITIVSTVFLISLYGFGQKFFGFPAFLTMNEEFAKGVPLRLPSTARFPSTFGGHYDLAAYLVLTIPLVVSFIFAIKKLYLKIILVCISIVALMMLLFTASRISFGVYLVSISTMLWMQKKRILIVPVVLASLLVMNFTSGASERFAKTFRVSDVVVDLSTGKPIGTLDSIKGQEATLSKSENPAKESLPTGSEFIGVGSSDTGKGKKVDTVTMFLTKNLSTGSGEISTVSGSFLIQKALVYDISITTRFQGQWPRAMEAFKRNIFLGSGFSALSVAADGDYHRMLGETGIVGTIAFLGIFLYAYYVFYKRITYLSGLERSFTIGVFAGLTGLLVNAILIDVFEASKVAFSFYLLLGVAVAFLSKGKGKVLGYTTFLFRFFTHRVMLMAYLTAIIFSVWSGALSMYFTGDDFTWLRWAAESKISDLSQYFIQSGGFFYRPVPKLWYFLMYSVFWLKPYAYHAGSLLLLCATTLLIYGYARMRRIGQTVSWFGALLFGVLSIHHENIFWVSGQSSQLAGFFAILSFVLLDISSTKRPYAIGYFISSVFAALCAMLSYDGMSLYPIALFIAGSFLYKRKLSIVFLLLIIGYGVIRIASGALMPQGDYAYNISKLFVNTAANISTYAVSSLYGPKAIEWAETLRAHMRHMVIPLTGIVVVFVGAIFVVIWKIRSHIFKFLHPGIMCIASLISLSAYVGLGGVAERYTYVASIFGILALMEIIWLILQKFRNILLTVCIGAVFAAIVGWNIIEVQRLSGDWIFAGKIVQQSIYGIKQETYPPLNVKTFYIINMPIRYGRAWIYPTGMTDAIWHMFRNNPYTVSMSPDLPTAFSSPFNGDREVFIFDNYIMKRGIQDTREVQK